MKTIFDESLYLAGCFPAGWLSAGRDFAGDWFAIDNRDQEPDQKSQGNSDFPTEARQPEVPLAA